MKIFNSKNGLSVKKSFRRYLIVLLLSLAFLFAVVTHAVAQNKTNSFPPTVCQIEPSPSKTTSPPSSTSPQIPESATFKYATIEFINAERTGLRIEQCNPDPSKAYPVNFSVDSPELKGILEGFASGDLVNLAYTNKKVLSSISVMTSPVSVSRRWWTIIITFLILIFLTWVILWVLTALRASLQQNPLVKQNPLAIRELFVGQDKRLSNSKSQMAVWFFVLIASYVSLTWLRAQSGGLGFVGGIGIPQNLLLLSGVSALTYAGAKVITQSQVNSKPGSKPEAKDGEASPADFVTDDQGNTDFGDFQMTVITILAVGVYCVQIFNFFGALKLYKSVTLPDVDTTILSIFGLSQGAYLTKKAAVATGAQEPLKLGAKGKDVKRLKALLDVEGILDANKAHLNVNDDNFDQSTLDAVKEFQTLHGINEGGIVGSETRKKLGLFMQEK